MKPKTDLTDLVNRARNGERPAAEALMSHLRDDIYRMAFRFLGGRSDAEDATQEILLKILTNLAAFRGESAVTTWAYRVATNHLLNVKRGQREVFSFEMLSAVNSQMLATPTEGLPIVQDEAVLSEEVRLGCTQAGVLSLDREHRIAFVLGVLFELDSDTAAQILEVEPATYRKRLQRARDRITEFMSSSCGLANPENACRCEKVARPCVAAKMIDPAKLEYASHPRSADLDVKRALAEAKDVQQRAFALMRSHPEYVSSGDFVEKLRSLLDDKKFPTLLQ